MKETGLHEKLQAAATDAFGMIASVVITDNTSAIKFFGADEKNGDVIFPLASAAKPITALLLTIREDKTDIERTDTVGEYIDIGFADRRVARITLEQLALHTSGLPKLATNLDPVDESDPYADYTREDLYAFLSESSLDNFDTTQGKKVYSNVGYAVLGHILELASGRSFDGLLQEYICQPLGMDNTTANPTPKQEDRFVVGHDENGNEVGRWHSQVMKGDGAVVTTPTDMRKFLREIMPGGKFFSHTQRMYEPYQTDEPGLHQVFGWMLGIPKNENGNAYYLAKGGESAGYQAFVGVSIDEPKAVALLANCKIEDLSASGVRFLVNT